MKKNLNIIGAVILICLAADFAFAQNQYQAEFDQANDLYRQARYSQAAEAYESIIKGGFVSGQLYYNLGNCYFKQQELGSAVLNYERAKIFMPRDSDLKANYEYAFNQLNLSSQQSSSRLGRWLDSLSAELGIDSMAIILSVLVLAIILLCLWSMFSGRASKLFKPAVFILVILLIITGVTLQRKISYLNKGAVVVAKEAGARFEPSESATQYFVLSEGVKVEVLDISGSWLKVRRSDKKIGWVNKEAVERILP
ncbi:MAG: SH3 domain-containing protein [Candidatus Omnitrophota bacterium]